MCVNKTEIARNFGKIIFLLMCNSSCGAKANVLGVYINKNVENSIFRSCDLPLVVWVRRAEQRLRRQNIRELSSSIIIT